MVWWALTFGNVLTMRNPSFRSYHSYRWDAKREAYRGCSGMMNSRNSVKKSYF